MYICFSEFLKTYRRCKLHRRPIETAAKQSKRLATLQEMSPGCSGANPETSKAQREEGIPRYLFFERAQRGPEKQRYQI